jgi:POT family proton-dependent oligopeptide transporter
MGKTKYITAPIASEKTPAGIPYILGNELGERFSFYGMRSILVFFMTHLLLNQVGELAPMTEDQSKVWFHLFVSAVYFTPLIGALISDIWLGKYRTILIFSVLYCFGFAALALYHTRAGLITGLVLIAIGSGVIKPCVSANVGDQFGQKNKHLMAKMYSWFYFAINLGAFGSIMLVPILLDRYNATVAFGVPGALMIAATLTFWLGREKYVHIPRGGIKFVKECFSGEGLRTIGKLAIIYLFVVPFWAMFDQMDSSWMLQAEKMDRMWFGREWLPTQIASANPLLIMAMIPIFSYAIYPLLHRIFPLTALRKIGLGLFVAALSFVVPAWTESHITGGDVFKCSSRSTVSDLEPIRLLDGKTDGTGWSSGKFDANEPQEIAIRLRERRAWTINRVAIDAATTLSADEIIAKLDELAMDNLRQLTKLRQSDDASQDEIDELAKAVELFGGAVRQARKAAGNQKGRSAEADAARAVAARILDEGGQGKDWLENRRYWPKKVSVFGADFGDKLIPKLLFELSDEEKEELADPEGYLAENGWKLLASGAVADGEESVEFEFEAVDATHVLVLVKSNYGVDRVKIGEVRVLTSEAVPEQSRRSAGDVWPNVAAVGFKPSVGWLFLAYIILTAAEVMVSITCLEFSYTQATKKMKSFIMAVFLLSISLGNAFTALVNKFIQNSDGTSKLEGPSYFWFFVIVMAVTAALFIPVAARYKVKDHIQDEDSEKSEE